MRSIRVRGLCPDSMFNSAYTLTITGEGRLRFLGHKTSSIQFDDASQLWRWLDMKERRSVATRIVISTRRKLLNSVENHAMR